MVSKIVRTLKRSDTALYLVMSEPRDDNTEAVWSKYQCKMYFELTYINWFVIHETAGTFS